MSALSELDAQIKEIDAQIAVLRAQAQKMRDGERIKVIEAVREKIDEYGITAADLNLEVTRGPRSRADGVSAASVRPQRVLKYRSAAGETWSGGPGRKPRWVADVLAQGKSIEDFAV